MRPPWLHRPWVLKLRHWLADRIRPARTKPIDIELPPADERAHISELIDGLV